MNQYINRKMSLSDKETFFLWGMRQTGKSTLLKQAFKNAFWIEVDFIVNHIDCAIEAKATYSVNKQHLKGLRQFMTDHPETKKRIIVSLDNKDRLTDDGIEILHYQTFLFQLWNGNFFS